MAPVYKLSTSRLSSRTSYSSMLAGNAAFIPTSFESIATTSVGSGGSSTISFTSIPNTYAHLQLRIFYKNTGSVFMTLNSTNATRGHYLYTSGSSVSSGTSGTNFIANASASQWGSAVVDIFDYKNTNKFVTVRTIAGYDSNGSGELSLNSQFYNLSSTAVNSITLTPTSGTFAEFSNFALYGIASA